MSVSKEIVHIAASLKPDQATLVPEKRQEITTEGGLNVVNNFNPIKEAIRILQDKGIMVSLFIDPVRKQVDKAKATGANMIEFHTGQYSRAKTKSTILCELKKIREAAAYAHRLGLSVNAGHGLNYGNAAAIAEIPHIEELNIGHAIVSQAVFVGLTDAVKEMIRLIR